MNLWAEEQSQHEAHDCDTRHMPCPNKGCGRIDIPFKDLHSHSTRTCDYRPIPCALDCGLSIPLVQKRRGGAGRENVTWCILCACVPVCLCVMSFLCILCVVRCVLYVWMLIKSITLRPSSYSWRYCEAETHMINTCSRRIMQCPNGCGMRLGEDVMEQHIEHEVR